MPIEIPLTKFKYYHDWQEAPLGAVLRVSNEAGDAVGVRCIHRDAQDEIPLLYAPEGDGRAAFFRHGELHTGAIDLTGLYEAVIVDPLLVSLTENHHPIQGLLLTTARGVMLAKGILGGRHNGYLSLGEPEAERWHVSFNGVPGLRVAGTIQFKPVQVAPR